MFNYVHLGEEILGQAQTKAGTERMTKKEEKSLQGALLFSIKIRICTWKSHSKTGCFTNREIRKFNPTKQALTAFLMGFGCETAFKLNQDSISLVSDRP